MRLKLDKPSKGKLLVAEPFLGDPSFERSVVLLTEHNNDGSVGFILNQPLDLSLDKLFEDFPSFEANVNYGGPVQKDSLYYIHNKGELIADSLKLSDDLYWGGNINAIKEMISANLITEKDIMFFLGYSGWGKTQLLDEIEENSWLIIENTAIDIIKKNHGDSWRSILSQLDGDYRLWANSPSDPILN